MLVLLLRMPQEVEQMQWFELYSNVSFVMFLIFASLMESVLNLAIFLCSSTKSALTTTMVKCLKNVLMSIWDVCGGRLFFLWLSFCGINLSIAASLIYVRATFKG